MVTEFQSGDQELMMSVSVQETETDAGDQISRNKAGTDDWSVCFSKYAVLMMVCVSVQETELMIRVLKLS